MKTSLLSILSVALLFSASWAQARPTESQICRDEAPRSNGVICCLENKNLCEEADQRLSPQDLNLISTWQQQLLPEPLVDGPNCYLFALSMMNPHISYPWKAMAPVDLMKYLEVTHRPLAHDEVPERGDIMLITVHGFERLKDMEEGKVVMKISPMTAVAHAAVYLGDNIVIQKENLMTTAISYSTLDVAVEHYLELTKASAPRPLKSAEPKVEYYRHR